MSFYIPSLNFENEPLTIEKVSAALDMGEKYVMANAPWSEFPYHPDVNFAIAHDGDNVFLKYYVEEENATARYNNTNDPVYKDSCVEFFIEFDDDKGYYNLEFNSAGACLAGFGRNKEDRILLPVELIEKIKYR